MTETLIFNDIVTAPVPEDMIGRAVVTSEEAVAAAECNGFPKEMRPGEREVALRLVTNDLDGGIPDPYGDDTLSYFDLSWVVVYHCDRRRPAVLQVAREIGDSRLTQ